MPSVRQALIQDLVLDRLAAIQVADGFNTDAGATVFFGMAPDMGLDDPPAALAVIVGDDARQQNPSKFVQVVVPIEIQGLVSVDRTRIAEPGIVREELLADVEKAMELSDGTQQVGLKKNLEAGPVRAFNREPGSTFIGFGITYLLRYGRPWGAP